MTQKELKEILQKHKKWLMDEVGGERADLRYVDLSNADLRYANLWYADLRYANLSNADLSNADLWNADLRYAENIPYVPMMCPEEGSFYAYKKVSGYIVKLLVPTDAKRSSATSRKCRCSYAKVISITNLDGSKTGAKEVINTNYAPSITYKVGEYVYPDKFDDNRWKECSNGIHFFINRQEAVNY